MLNEAPPLEGPNLGRGFMRRWNALENLWKCLHDSGTGTTGPGAFQACNCAYPNQERGHKDFDLLEALILKGSGDLYRLCNSVAVKDLCCFNPLIENEGVKRKIRSLETELGRLRGDLNCQDGDSQDLQKRIDATERKREELNRPLREKHRAALKAFQLYQDNGNGNTKDFLIEQLCRLVTLVRNNESHLGKLVVGDDDETRRNREIFKRAIGVLDVFFEELLESPDQRLARPGFSGVNDSVDEIIADIKVESKRGRVEGEVVEGNGGQAFSWKTGTGESIDVEALESDQLAEYWERIDAFYGQGWRRILVPVNIGGQEKICSVYEIVR